MSTIPNTSSIPRELLFPSDTFLSVTGNIGLYWWYWYLKEEQLILSPALLDLLNLRQEDLDQSLQSLYRNIHPEDVKQNRERLYALVRGESALYELEYRIRSESGEWKWFYNRGIVLERDQKGNPSVIGGLSMEISGQFKKLLSMVEGRDKFEFIFRHSTEAILVMEIQEEQIFLAREANQAAMELFERSEKDVGTAQTHDLLTPDLQAVVKELISQIRETGRAHLERKVHVTDKKVRWLGFRALSFNLTGEDLVIVIVTDLTAGKKTEAALRETEKLYRTLFEAANDRIGLFTTTGKVLLVNSAFYESLGYTRDEFLAMEQQETVHPGDRARLAAEYQQVQHQRVSSHEYRVRHKDGQYLDMSSKIVRIPGEAGEEDLLLFIMRDITGSKAVIKELELAKEKAEESDKLKSAFLANMSHEIRTPMNSIVGFSNLLSGSELDEETRDIYIKRITSNSELLLALISDIIDLAKIESGQLSIIYGHLLVSELIHDMEQYAREEADRLSKTNLEIKATLCLEDQVLETDVIRVAQVMRNLINNAIKFTEHGSVELGCKPGADEHSLVLFVSDTGMGIAPEHSKLIFEQFRQIDGSNTRKFSGTGLGLAICQNLVRLMKGQIRVKSEPGNGSCFEVELPLKAQGKHPTGERPYLQKTSSLKSEEQYAILVVDDEPDSLELYSAMLSQMGMRVRTAGNGYEALQVLEQYALPHMVMMDIELPVLSGIDTFQIIRERYPDLKVIAHSAHALAGDRDRFLKEGFDEYLPKPFTPDQLDQVILRLKTT